MLSYFVLKARVSAPCITLMRINENTFFCWGKIGVGDNFIVVKGRITNRRDAGKKQNKGAGGGGPATQQSPSGKTSR